MDGLKSGWMIIKSPDTKPSLDHERCLSVPTSMPVSTENGKAYPQPVAKQVSPKHAETRSLDVYEQLLEVGA